MDKLLAQEDFLKQFNIKDADYQKTGLKWEELEKIYEDHINNIPFLESQLNILFSIFIKIPNVHSVKYRVKNPEHLIEKIIRKKITNPDRNITLDTYISELDDIIGLRVLHLYKDEWKNVHDHIISKKYKLKESPIAYHREGDSQEYLDEYIQNGCTPKQHKYGYRSIHYIIQQKILSTTIACEVQVRTVFEEAWSEIDHSIRYPYEIDNPIYKQYLMIVNRLAGSADEMGTFVVHLKEHLQEEAIKHHEELDRKNSVISELKKEISELKVGKEKLESINDKIEKLKDNYIAETLFYPPGYNQLLNKIQSTAINSNLDSLQNTLHYWNIQPTRILWDTTSAINDAINSTQLNHLYESLSLAPNIHKILNQMKNISDTIKETSKGISSTDDSDENNS